MRITFVLPMFLATPTGGFKVVYEYANRLAARGHQVTLVHPRNVTPQSGFTETLKAQLWPLKLHWHHRPLIGWFPLAKEVQVNLVPDLRERFLPEADVLVATAFETAFAVSDCQPIRGKKFYLIQSYEDWLGEAERVKESWQLPLHKIVISQWLHDLAREMGQVATYIPNGLDFKQFFCELPPAERNPFTVAMNAHPLPLKGTADGLAALQIARERLPELSATLYGTMPRPADWPDWCAYQQLPAPDQLRGIYNNAAVFLNPSVSEGWGLPAMEAMACGCALVSADNQGVRDFAIDGKSALLAPVQRPDLLAEQLYTVITNDVLRLNLSQAAEQSVRRFTWERAVNALETLFASGASR